jgi:hypothetical protein
MTETPLSPRRWALEECERGRVKVRDTDQNRVTGWVNVSPNMVRSTH